MTIVEKLTDLLTNGERPVSRERALAIAKWWVESGPQVEPWSDRKVVLNRATGSQAMTIPERIALLQQALALTERAGEGLSIDSSPDRWTEGFTLGWTKASLESAAGSLRAVVAMLERLQTERKT